MKKVLEPVNCRDTEVQRAVIVESRKGFAGTIKNTHTYNGCEIERKAQREFLESIAEFCNTLHTEHSHMRPAAYIVCLLDTDLLKGPESEACIDLGIATQNMLLGAAEAGVFGCRIGAFASGEVARLLRLDGHLRPLLIVALGYPAETVALEEMKNGDVRYWHDAQGVHHVPKRALDELLVASPEMP